MDQTGGTAHHFLPYFIGPNGHVIPVATRRLGNVVFPGAQEENGAGLADTVLSVHASLPGLCFSVHALPVSCTHQRSLSMVSSLLAALCCCAGGKMQAWGAGEFVSPETPHTHRWGPEHKYHSFLTPQQAILGMPYRHRLSEALGNEGPALCGGGPQPLASPSLSHTPTVPQGSPSKVTTCS
jgi:hypothetical protein